MSYTCPLCDGRGCEECDDTGRRYGELHEVDGATLHVSGSGDGASPELVEMLAVLSRAALTPMREERS